MGYSFVFLCRKAPAQVWLFIVTLVGVNALALMLPDLIVGGQRSGTHRYLIPCYLGIQLAVAYLLATKLTFIQGNIYQHKFWQEAKQVFSKNLELISQLRPIRLWKLVKQEAN
ncbi:MAG: hypothetical protein LDL41_05995 [Coleofasciculus sp. S288]|nr:hypothetical protein [Coleofasciculus sp. S288]